MKSEGGDDEEDLELSLECEIESRCCYCAVLLLLLCVSELHFFLQFPFLPLLEHSSSSQRNAPESRNPHRNAVRTAALLTRPKKSSRSRRDPEVEVGRRRQKSKILEISPVKLMAERDLEEGLAEQP